MQTCYFWSKEWIKVLKNIKRYLSRVQFNWMWFNGWFCHWISLQFKGVLASRFIDWRENIALWNKELKIWNEMKCIPTAVFNFYFALIFLVLIAFKKGVHVQYSVIIKVMINFQWKHVHISEPMLLVNLMSNEANNNVKKTKHWKYLKN